MNKHVRDSEGRQVGLDEAFYALSNQLRRRLLVGLLDANPQSDRLIGDIADEATGSNVDATLYRTAMYHNHLPKLEALGYIYWNRDSHEVTKGPQFRTIRPLLELLDANASEIPDEWP